MTKTLPKNQQPAQRLLEKGINALSNYELLNLILGCDKGRELLCEFGSLTGLFQALPAEMTRVKGIGQTKAVTVAAALELGRRMVIENKGDRPRITAPADMANVLMADMQHLEQEHLVVLAIDSRNHLIKKETVYIGSVGGATVRIGEIFRTAIRLNAVVIGVAHNHPSGDPAPSKADIEVTKLIVEAGKLMDIAVLDHLVIGHGRFVSMRERGLGFD